MQTPPDQFTSPPPAPQIVSPKVTISYDDVVRTARCSVLDDFRRQQEYRMRRKHLEQTGGNISSISTIGISDTTTITKASTNRLLKEHSSSAWSLWFYQWSLFGGFAVTSVGTVMATYLGVCHNRMFITFAPFCGVCAYKTWIMLESAWEQKRFMENAAQIRNQRVGNPLSSIRSSSSDEVQERGLQDIDD